jgi:hypothetical protein
MGTTSFTASEAALHEAAIERAGFDDFGDPYYLEGLRMVLDSYDNEAKFSEAGREVAYHGLVDILTKRLLSEKLLKAQPAVLENGIRRPIVILGLVRTGSTALHHLMGQDPAIQVIEYWLGNFPQPRPPRNEWETHPDYTKCVTELELMYAANPSLKSIHLMMADGPEECRHFLAQSFTDDYFEVNSSIPTYTKWYEEKNLEPTYRRHRDLLKLVGSTSPERPWILKYPVHMKNLAALLEVYPDACIVWTHRDPSQVLSSYISLVAGFRAFFEKDIDRDAIGQEQLDVWAAGAEKGIEVRRRHDPSQFYDLHFRDFTTDSVGSVRQIYEHFGLEFSEESERCLARWELDNPKGRHGTHKHSMADVTLSREATLERFQGYMDHFGIEPE